MHVRNVVTAVVLSVALTIVGNDVVLALRSVQGGAKPAAGGEVWLYRRPLN